MARLKKKFGQYVKDLKPNRKLSISDVLAIIGILLTIVFSYWGIQLSKLNMRQSQEIANQQQQIKGFDSLLKMTKSEVSLLIRQDNLLSRQLAVSNNFLAFQNSNIKSSYKSGLASLMQTENELKLIVWQPHIYPNVLGDWSDPEREDFIAVVKPLLEKEISNTFLIQNTLFIRNGFLLMTL